jgi:hypothetical protein
MVRYELTLSSSRNETLTSVDTVATANPDLWFATRLAMRRLMARRITDPHRGAWDLWALAVIEPATGTRRPIARGGVNQIHWRDQAGLRTGHDGR